MIVNRQINGKYFIEGTITMNLKTFCLTAATVAALSLNATWVHAEEDGDDNSVNGVETNTVNSQGNSCYGHVIQVSAYTEGSPSYIYLRKSAKSNGYYYGTTADPILINAALHAMNGPTQVRIYSEYGCGGNNGSNNIGGIYRIRVNP